MLQNSTQPLAVLIAFVAVQCFSQSVDQTEFLPVDEAYPTQIALTDDGKVRVSWIMPEGYYLYRHSLGIEGLEGTQVGELVVPEGILKHDEFFGETEVYYKFLEIDAPIESQAGDVVVRVDYQGCADAGLCYPPESRVFRLAVAGISVDSGSGSGPLLASDATTGVSIWLALGSALIAGLILNLMPCVFPVLSLKAVAVIQSSEHQSNLPHAIGYTLGIVGTLVVVAMLLVALRAAGEAIGWGFQLQSPAFVVCMALVFFVLGLNMLGLLEIPGFGVSMSTSNAVSTGFLAVVVATPCTVPFMASAIGYGLMQGGVELVLIMIALGVGLALPYVLVTTVPAIAKLLPKPGAWLGVFKTIMAFPLLLSAVWLVWVLTRQEGDMATVWVLVGAVVLGGLMLLGRSYVRYLRPVWLSMLLVIGGIAWGVASINTPVSAGQQSSFSLAEFDRQVTSQRPVFANVTADWCLTCLVNEQSTLSRASVTEFFDQQGIEYIKVDWTHRDAQVTQLLERFGRVGVPMYVHYPAEGEPHLLPQILTPNLLFAELTHDSQDATIALQ